MAMAMAPHEDCVSRTSRPRTGAPYPTRRPVSLADCASIACTGPEDSIASLDAMLIAMARDEQIDLVVDL